MNILEEAFSQARREQELHTYMPCLLSVCLQIAAQPEVKVRISRRYIFPGDDVQLICESSGLVRPQMYWSKEGRLVSTRRDYAFEDNKLVIRNITVSHQGKYFCAASNSVDGVASSGVELYLSGLGIRAPVFDVERIMRTVFEGENVVFNCDPRLDTTEGLAVSWARTDALPLPEGHVITANNSLMLLNVVTADEGTYRCTATNVLGTAFLDYRLEVESKQCTMLCIFSNPQTLHYCATYKAPDYRAVVLIYDYTYLQVYELPGLWSQLSCLSSMFYVVHELECFSFLDHPAVYCPSILWCTCTLLYH